MKRDDPQLMTTSGGWGKSFIIGKCAYGHDIVKRQEDLGPGEIKRESWWCRCSREQPKGEMVEFATRGAKRA